MYKPKDDILDLDFILYFFLRKKGKYILELASPGGAGRNKTLGQNEFAKSKVIIPQFVKEQQKIAAFLNSIIKKISLLEQKKENLEQYKKGVMQKIFSQEIRFRDENNNYYPDWEEKKIKDVFEITRGYVLAVGNMKQEIDVEFKYPVYSSQTKNNGLTGYYNKFLYEDSITWTTDGANAGDVKYRSDKFYCTNVCGVLISKDGNANKCMAEILNSVSKRFVSYVGNPKLMNNVMANIKINFPSVKEQQKIASFLSTIDTKIEHTNRQIEKSKEFKKGLLQQMFV